MKKLKVLLIVLTTSIVTYAQCPYNLVFRQESYVELSNLTSVNANEEWQGNSSNDLGIARPIFDKTIVTPKIIKLKP